MRRTGPAAILAVLLAAGTAAADVQPPGPTAPAQQLSVWRFTEGGDAEHLQSGLVCPARFQGYTRRDLHVYDGWGLDVSCDYIRQGSNATIYLTRLPNLNVDAVYEDAKRSFLRLKASLNPRLRAETHPTDGGLNWDLAIYDDDGGLADMVWIGDLHGWMLEYRVTYRAADESRVRAEVAAWTDAVQASAGERLTLCAKSPEPARTGAPITDVQAVSSASLMTALSAAAQANGRAPSGPPAPALAAWCVDHTASAGPTRLMLWRGVAADGADAAVDQINAMTPGSPLALVVRPDPMAPASEPGGGRWAATVSDGTRTDAYGYFTARPAPTPLAALYLNILQGRAHPLSSYDSQSHTVSIPTPAR